VSDYTQKTAAQNKSNKKRGTSAKRSASESPDGNASSDDSRDIEGGKMEDEGGRSEVKKKKHGKYNNTLLEDEYHLPLAFYLIENYNRGYYKAI
jgi:hypothetical protein